MGYLNDLLAPIKTMREDFAVGLAVIPRSQGAPLISLADIDPFAENLPTLISRTFHAAEGAWGLTAKERSVEITGDWNPLARLSL